MRIAIYGKRFDQVFNGHCTKLFNSLADVEAELYVFKPDRKSVV